MANDPKKPAAETEAAEAAPNAKALLKQLQAKTDPKERKEFFIAHPELREFVSEVNFH